VQIGVSPQSGLLIHVTWQGNDGAGSGIDHYDVQYSPNGMNWTDWLVDSQQTDAPYLGADGLTYYFRVRAVDQAGNTSNWGGGNTVVYSVTKYYAFGAQQVAMRQCNSSGCADAMYLHGDHPSLCSGQALGSVSLVTDSTGSVVSQARYTPYGELRWPDVSQIPTDFGYTGQRADSFGLMDYNARFYSPHLGRFVSADTVVPNPGKAVSFDRFVYGDSNPIKYRDPSGHLSCDSKYVAEGDCSDVSLSDILANEYGVTLNGWTPQEIYQIWIALNRIGSALSSISGGYLGSPSEAFVKVFGGLTFTKSGSGNGCEAGGSGFTCGTGVDFDARLATHELGHTLNAVIINNETHRLQNAGWSYDDALARATSTVGPYYDLANAAIEDSLGNWVMGTHPGGVYERTKLGYKSGGPPDMYHGSDDWADWNSNANNLARNEDFADMFMNWVFDNFDYGSAANGAWAARDNWMTTNMAEWIGQATR
jgi:RHS repeat-associated protein